MSVKTIRHLGSPVRIYESKTELFGYADCSTTMVGNKGEFIVPKGFFMVSMGGEKCTVISISDEFIEDLRHNGYKLPKNN